MKPSIKNIFLLEPFRGQKVTLCQRVSQSDSKWTRKRKQTDKHTHKHFRIYISRDMWSECENNELIHLYTRTHRLEQCTLHIRYTLRTTHYVHIKSALMTAIQGYCKRVVWCSSTFRMTQTCTYSNSLASIWTIEQFSHCINYSYKWSHCIRYGRKINMVHESSLFDVD